MKYIVPLVWTTDIDDVDCGEYLAIVKIPNSYGTGKPTMVSYTEVEKLPFGNGWKYKGSKEKLPAGCSVMAVADRGLYPSTEAVEKLMTVSNLENYGIKEKDFDDLVGKMNDASREAYANREYED